MGALVRGLGIREDHGWEHDGDSEEPDDERRIAEGRLQGAERRVGVETLVEVCLLELVGSQHPVEHLMPELVDRHALGRMRGRGRELAGAADEERRVFHALGVAAPRRVDDGEDGVGIGQIEPAVIRESRLHGLQIPVSDGPVVGLQEKHDVYIREAVRAERVAHHFEARAGREREIVYVLGCEMHAHEIARKIDFVLEDARGADAALHGLRKGEGDVVVAEVGEELGRGMELVRVPALVGCHAELRKPLRAEQIIVLPAGARHRAGKLAFPVDAENERLAGRDGPRQGDGNESPVVRIPVVRGDVLQGGGQVGAVLEADAVDLREPPAARVLRAHATVVPPGAARLLGEPCRAIVLPGVQIEVEPEVVERKTRAVREPHRFFPGDAVLRGHVRLDRVGRDGRDARTGVETRRGEEYDESGRPRGEQTNHDRGC